MSYRGILTVADIPHILYAGSVISGAMYGLCKGFAYGREEYLNGSRYAGEIVVASVGGGIMGAMAGAIPPIGIAALYVIEFEKPKTDTRLRRCKN